MCDLVTLFELIVHSLKNFPDLFVFSFWNVHSSVCIGACHLAYTFDPCDVCLFPLLWRNVSRKHWNCSVGNLLDPSGIKWDKACKAFT